MINAAQKLPRASTSSGKAVARLRVVARTHLSRERAHTLRSSARNGPERTRAKPNMARASTSGGNGTFVLLPHSQQTPAKPVKPHIQPPQLGQVNSTVTSFRPQCGQTTAVSLIALLHFGHGIKAIGDCSF